MKITAKLTVTAAACSVLVTLCVATIFQTSAHVREQFAVNAMATRISDQLIALRYLTFEYLLQPTERVKVQWNLQHATLRSTLESAEHSTSMDTRAVLRMHETTAGLRDLFVELIAVESGPMPASQGIALDTRLRGQFLAKVESMNSDAAQLAGESRNAVADAFARVGNVVLASGATLVFIVSGLLLWVGTSIRAPLLQLRRGAAIVGAGDLSHRIGLAQHDELGELGAGFDAMTSRLEKSYLALETANRELEAFSYSISHDLRAPLRSIDGFSQALLEDYAGKLDDEGRDHLRRVRAATQRMEKLIDDLLGLSSISRAPMAKESVDLSALARAAADALVANDPARNASFDVVPKAQASGDKRLLAVALKQLLSNAWKFTNQCAPARIEFDVTKNDAGETVYFVRDNGAGFDMKHADKLFAPFESLHHATSGAGSGIGLAVVKRIAQRHGGRVWAEGESGKGATFYFTLAPAPPAGAQGIPHAAA